MVEPAGVEPAPGALEWRCLTPFGDGPSVNIDGGEWGDRRESNPLLALFKGAALLRLATITIEFTRNALPSRCAVSGVYLGILLPLCPVILWSGGEHSSLARTGL